MWVEVSLKCKWLELADLRASLLYKLQMFDLLVTSHTSHDVYSVGHLGFTTRCGSFRGRYICSSWLHITSQHQDCGIERWTGGENKLIGCNMQLRTLLLIHDESVSCYKLPGLESVATAKKYLDHFCIRIWRSCVCLPNSFSD